MDDLNEPLSVAAENLGRIADAINNLARAVQLLGNADAATPMGAMEALGAVFERGLSQIADSISELEP